MTRLCSRPVLAAILGLSLAAAPTALAQAASHKKAEPHPRAGLLHGYTTEAAAKTGCGAGGVVWHARNSHYFHLPASRYFGKTRGGAFVCQKDAEAKGLHAAKS